MTEVYHPIQQNISDLMLPKCGTAVRRPFQAVKPGMIRGIAVETDKL